MKYNLIANPVTGDIIGTTTDAAGPQGEYLIVENPSGVSDPARLCLSNGNVALREPRPSMAHRWNHGWVIDPLLADGEAKRKRTNLLSESDWTQMPDVPNPQKVQWAQYRQALRDITDQPGYPLNVVWPIPPA